MKASRISNAKRLPPDILTSYREWLEQNEYAAATIKKYMNTARSFCQQVGDDIVTREAVLEIKENWLAHGAVSSTNGHIAALNRFFTFLGWPEYRLKAVRLQTKSCRDQSRELTRREYRRLLDTARFGGDEQIFYILQTLGSTGIRISELHFITVEAVYKGCATVWNKGKVRNIFLPGILCSRLRKYCSLHRIITGSVFVTGTGKAVDRSNVWRRMKVLAVKARVDPAKVYPHNLRHLFACTFYEKLHDLDHLAVILGHSSIDTTRIYTQTSVDEYHRQVEALHLVV